MTGKLERRLISEFERTLDATLHRCRLLTLDPVRAIENVAGMISLSFSNTQPTMSAMALGHRFCDAFDVMLPLLIGSHSRAFPANAAEIILNDMQFMADYYVLREYLYYSYNAPNSFSWEFDNNSIRLSFADKSIPRQFAHMWNSEIVGLIPIHQDGDRRSRRLHELLHGAQEYGDGGHIQEAFELVAEEADARIELKFDLLGGESSEVSFKDYDYATFYRVYRYLFTKMLYHRYYANANSTWATFKFPVKPFMREMVNGAGVDPSTIDKVLRDLVYTRDCGRIPPMYYPMVRHSRSKSFIAAPERMISSDGLAQILKIQAAKHPGWFNSKVSGTLGSNFVDNLGSQIEASGFKVLKGLQLRQFDRSAPDIDLLVISREATLGYVVFAIEAKATIPGLWAKDYLRVLDPDSLTKAYSQVDKVLSLLSTPAVADHVVNEVLRSDPRPLPSGLVLIHKLIVTSQNAGMFFDNADTQAIDYRTLTYLFSNCDGDVLYVLNGLRVLNAGVDFEVVPQTIQIGDYKLTYDAVQMGDPLVPSRNRWRTGGIEEEVTKTFFKEGGELFDPRRHVAFKDGRPISGDDVS